MARKKVAGPKIEQGIRIEVVPANKKSLQKIAEAYPALEFISFSPQQFVGRDKGAEHLKENADKWSGKYAPYIMIRDVISLKVPKVTDLRKKLESEEKSLETIKARTDAGSFKSKLASCPGCDSKVNRAYIKESKCPVCGEDLRSKSASANIKAKEERISSLNRKLAIECAKHSQEAPLKYLVVVPAESN